MATDVTAGIGSLDELHGVLPGLNYTALWTVRAGLGTEPVTDMVPYLWRYEEVRSLILRAGDLISAEEAERRALSLCNPGTSDGQLARATDTLWAAIQMVLPGEVAPPHRHTASALRFVIEGSGAYSIVGDRRWEMQPGDVLVAPNWTWHEHGHRGEGPMIWLDGLDLPMVLAFHARFAEETDELLEGRDVEPAVLRSGDLRPLWQRDGAVTLAYRLADAEAAFDDLRREAGSPFDDLIVEYRNPATNGPLLPTISAYIQLLRPGVETRAHRHTASAVYHVVRGAGTTEIAGTSFPWQEGDTFAVPVWAEHRHMNAGTDDALLFSFSDAPAVEALGWLRVQPDS